MENVKRKIEERIKELQCDEEVANEKDKLILGFAIWELMGIHNFIEENCSCGIVEI